MTETYRYTGKSTQQFENGEVYELTAHQHEFIGDQFESAEGESATDTAGADDEPVAAESTDTTSDGGDLTDINGVGDGLAERLAAEGLDSLNAIREATHEAVADALDDVPSADPEDIKQKAHDKE